MIDLRKDVTDFGIKTSFNKLVGLISFKVSYGIPMFTEKSNTNGNVCEFVFSFLVRLGIKSKTSRRRISNKSIVE